MTGLVEHRHSHAFLPSADTFPTRSHKRQPSTSSLRQPQINPNIRKQINTNVIRRAIAKHVLATGRSVHNNHLFDILELEQSEPIPPVPAIPKSIPEPPRSQPRVSIPETVNITPPKRSPTPSQPRATSSHSRKASQTHSRNNSGSSLKSLRKSSSSPLFSQVDIQFPKTNCSIANFDPTSLDHPFFFGSNIAQKLSPGKEIYYGELPPSWLFLCMHIIDEVVELTTLEDRLSPVETYMTKHKNKLRRVCQCSELALLTTNPDEISNDWTYSPISLILDYLFAKTVASLPPKKDFTTITTLPIIRQITQELRENNKLLLFYILSLLRYLCVSRSATERLITHLHPILLSEDETPLTRSFLTFLLQNAPILFSSTSIRYCGNIGTFVEKDSVETMTMHGGVEASVQEMRSAGQAAVPVYTIRHLSFSELSAKAVQEERMTEGTPISGADLVYARFMREARERVSRGGMV